MRAAARSVSGCVGSRRGSGGAVRSTTETRTDGSEGNSWITAVCSCLTSLALRRKVSVRPSDKTAQMTNCTSQPLMRKRGTDSNGTSGHVDARGATERGGATGGAGLWRNLDVAITGAAGGCGGACAVDLVPSFLKGYAMHREQIRAVALGGERVREPRAKVRRNRPLMHNAHSEMHMHNDALLGCHRRFEPRKSNFPLPPSPPSLSMSALDQLQLLSLVQKVCQELETHVGISDKDLAEFIIDMADQSDTVHAFSKQLAANDAEFPDELNIALFSLIRRMRPKKPSAAAAAKVRGLASLAVLPWFPTHASARRDCQVARFGDRACSRLVSNGLCRRPPWPVRIPCSPAWHNPTRHPFPSTKSA